jgi:hypothetical protein
MDQLDPSGKKIIIDGLRHLQVESGGDFFLDIIDMVQHGLLRPEWIELIRMGLNSLYVGYCDRYATLTRENNPDEIPAIREKMSLIKKTFELL